MNNQDTTIVSVVIVCMNNLGNLLPCLNSIKTHTKCDYEVWVVAYLFSQDNLNNLRKSHPWVKIVESNDIHGFAENNNLALRLVKGRYCFILNDDTLFEYDVLFELKSALINTPDAVVMSPKTVFGDGRIQSCGRPKMTMGTFMLQQLGLWKEQNISSKYTYKEGIFQTYNIVGAAFLIYTDIFKKVGFFDDRYFFCPEDVALSTQLNRLGYKCYVNSNSYIIHLEGGSSSNIVHATYPARIKGELIFFTESNRFKKIILYPFVFIVLFAKYFIMSGISFLSIRDDASKMCKAYINSLKIIFSSKTTKEIFIKYYRGKDKQ